MPNCLFLSVFFFIESLFTIYPVKFNCLPQHFGGVKNTFFNGMSSCLNNIYAISYVRTTNPERIIDHLRTIKFTLRLRETSEPVRVQLRERNSYFINIIKKCF